MSNGANGEIIKEIRIAIAQIGGQKQLALALDMSEADISRKLNGDRGWTIDELEKLFQVLGLKVVPKESQEHRLLIKLLAKKVSELL
ncbi:MAG: DUF739 family protein [Candidatus Aenigmatarchaeota archaeon]